MFNFLHEHIEYQSGVLILFSIVFRDNLAEVWGISNLFPAILLLVLYVLEVNALLLLLYL